jgi:hypothetical protein
MVKARNSTTTKAKATKATKAKAARKPYGMDAKITLLTKENPKTRGTKCFRRYAKYKNTMTVQQALAAGVTRPDLRWDSDHKFIRIS